MDMHWIGMVPGEFSEIYESTGAREAGIRTRTASYSPPGVHHDHPH